ncbi:hypothetical protein GTO27_02620 [Candidatus Bathyarchaeota archaeon]|nr:hypothetical protein [Candidatus Bathyarchaeota archaeon]
MRRHVQPSLGSNWTIIIEKELKLSSADPLIPLKNMDLDTGFLSPIVNPHM